jgi:hypothetical protein
MINNKLYITHGALYFWCPGCIRPHAVSIATNTGWEFNGDYVLPTFMPSVLVRSGHYLPRHKEGDNCWCSFNKENPDKASFDCIQCHSYIKDGNIQFLGDSSHKLAGQTVPLPNFPEDYRMT